MSDGNATLCVSGEGGGNGGEDKEMVNLPKSHLTTCGPSKLNGTKCFSPRSLHSKWGSGQQVTFYAQTPVAATNQIWRGKSLHFLSTLNCRLI